MTPNTPALALMRERVEIGVPVPTDIARCVLAELDQLRSFPARVEARFVVVVKAWRELQSRPFVMPPEMTDLAVALDALDMAFAALPVAAPEETS